MNFLTRLFKMKVRGKRERRLTMEAKSWEYHHDEEDRKIIYEWSEKRRREFRGVKKSYNQFLIYTFSIDTLISFINNFNFMVLIQMGLAGVAVYVFQFFDIWFDVHVSLFVSPIVFPLAFSINTDFQRREKVLDDLANFKSAAMVFFFCMRDWKEMAGLDDDWFKTVHSKIKSMLFHLREFLLTDRAERRKVILRAMYEDFSDTNQLIEKVRLSRLPANPAIISRVIHLLNMLSLSFERLRNVREYRSPRSIRSFNKVLIFFLPFILAPYFVYLGRNIENNWSPYYIAILVAFVFGALQGVQDKLDDPFDGMSEDDINLSTIDEWTFHSLDVTVNRSFKVGRFQVSANIEATETSKPRAATMIPQAFDNPDTIHPPVAEKFNHLRQSSVKSNLPVDRTPSTKRAKTRGLSFFHDNHSFKRKATLHVPPLHARESSLDTHPYLDLLEKIQGDVPIRRGGHVTPSENTQFKSINELFQQANEDDMKERNTKSKFETSIDMMEKLEETSLNHPITPPGNNSQEGDKRPSKKLHFSLRRIDSGVLSEDNSSIPLKKVESEVLSDSSVSSSPPNTRPRAPLIPSDPPKVSRFKLTHFGGRVKSSASSPTLSSVSQQPLEAKRKTSGESSNSHRGSIQSDILYMHDRPPLNEDEVFI